MDREEKFENLLHNVKEIEMLIDRCGNKTPYEVLDLLESMGEKERPAFIFALTAAATTWRQWIRKHQH